MLACFQARALEQGLKRSAFFPVAGRRASGVALPQQSVATRWLSSNNFQATYASCKNNGVGVGVG
jgi:hypothetical protein